MLSMILLLSPSVVTDFQDVHSPYRAPLTVTVTQRLTNQLIIIQYQDPPMGPLVHPQSTPARTYATSRRQRPEPGTQTRPKCAWAAQERAYERRY